MEKAQKIFTDFLKKKGLKLTSQREEILNQFLKLTRHLSAEEFYDVIKKNNPDMGGATVFRTLKLLREAAIAREVNLGDKITRYECKYGHLHHDHLICTVCGKFIEVFDAAIERRQKTLCKKFGFVAQKHRMEIFGTCKQCRKRS